MASNIVYTGLWTDWSKGPILGCTITFSVRDALYLLAFLAFFVTLVATSFWRLLGFLAHQIRSNQRPQNIFYRQQQILLRNSNNPLCASCSFFGLTRAWRKRGLRGFWWGGPLFLGLGALFIFASFVAAAVLSSYVGRPTGTDLIIQSLHPGFWSFPNRTDLRYPAWEEKVLNQTLSAAAYARSCYTDKIQNSLECSTFNQPFLNWSSNTNADCPFATGTCMLTDTPAYQMNTGFLDSHTDLGLNARSSERLSLQKITTCAPLSAGHYSTQANSSVEGSQSSDPYLRLYMGPLGSISNDFVTNWTYQYDIHESSMNIGYDIQTVGSAESSWLPIADFKRNDADVSLFIIAANAVQYEYMIDDPIFAAHHAISEIVRGVEVTTYGADDWFNVIGCIDQYRVCNPAGNRTAGSQICTSLTSQAQLTLELKNNTIGMNKYQYATAVFLLNNIAYSNLYYSVKGRGPSSLEASESLFDLSQGAKLPKTQWQNEVGNWFSISLARIQQSMLDAALGPQGVLENGGAISYPTDKAGREILNRQKIRNNGGYLNISVLGLSIVLGVGLLTILMGSMMDTLPCGGKIGKKTTRRRVAWITDGLLQQQRMAYEGHGYHGWQQCDGAYPIIPGTIMGSTDYADLEIDQAGNPQIRSFALATPTDSTASVDMNLTPVSTVKLVNDPAGGHPITKTDPRTGLPKSSMEDDSRPILDGDGMSLSHSPPISEEGDIEMENVVSEAHGPISWPQFSRPSVASSGGGISPV